MFDSYRLVIKNYTGVRISIDFDSPRDLMKELPAIGAVDKKRVDDLIHELWTKYDKEVDRNNEFWIDAVYWSCGGGTNLECSYMYLYGVHEKKRKNIYKLIASGNHYDLGNKSWVELTLDEKEKKIWDKLMKKD